MFGRGRRRAGGPAGSSSSPPPGGPSTSYYPSGYHYLAYSWGLIVIPHMLSISASIVKSTFAQVQKVVQGSLDRFPAEDLSGGLAYVP